MSVNGHAVAATAPSVCYNKGALDGRDVAPGQTDLWWNGTLVVGADKSLFHAGTAHTAETAERQAADSVWSHAGFDDAFGSAFATARDLMARSPTAP